MAKIAILGVAGRMGRMLARECLRVGADLVGGTEAANSPFLGHRIGELINDPAATSLITSDTAALFARADAAIDFTAPQAGLSHLALASQVGTPFVLGTTGFDADGRRQIEAAAQKIPICWTANFSLGLTLMTALVARVAATLDDDYDIEIMEMHHRHKVDAPSGSALALGRAAALGRKVSLDQHAVMSRVGQTGPREAGKIGFATLRGGDVIGDHSVIFAGEGERLELSHKASDRSVFAHGAVKAAKWLVGAKPGLYDMNDVLGLR